MPRGFDKKTLKLEQDGICARVRGNLTAMVWKDKWDVHILTNMQRVPTEGNFYDEQGKAQKPVIITDYNQHRGYADEGYRMAI